MKRTTHAYETLHSLHNNAYETFQSCPDCQELMERQEANDVKIDQAVEDKYHNHGDRS